MDTGVSGADRHEGALARRAPRVRVALGLALAAALALGCAPTRADAPPRPELVGPHTAQPDDPATPTTVPVIPSTIARTTLPVNDAGSESAVPPDPEGLERRGGLEADRAHPWFAAIPSPVGPVPDDPAITPEDRNGFDEEPAEQAGWVVFEDTIRQAVLRGGTRAVAMAVVVDGQLLRSAAFGESRPDVPVERSDKFRIASLSKPITAIVALQLVEEGLIRLDEPVGERIARSLGREGVSPRVAAITLEQLLSHTSGFPVHWGWFFGDGASACPQVAVAAINASVGPPGVYRYSNVNYCVTGLLIEDLTGQPYEEVVHERLLRPLGISGMRLAGTYDVGPGEVLHPSRPGRNYMEALGGAGAWIASAEDVALILGSLDPTTSRWRPLGDELLDRLRRPPGGAATGEYGLGVFLHPDGTISHTGTLEQNRAMAAQRPDGVTWVVLVNGERPDRSSEIAGIVARAFAAAFPDG